MFASDDAQQGSEALDEASGFCGKGGGDVFAKYRDEGAF